MSSSEGGRSDERQRSCRRPATVADCLTWGSSDQYAGYTRSWNATGVRRADPAELPTAGGKVTWSSVNDDFRRRRFAQQGNTILHTNAEWTYSPTKDRQKYYPPPTPPVELHPPTNKPDFQLDITDVEGARPRGRPGLAHHRSASSPTSRTWETGRHSNPLVPKYPWGNGEKRGGHEAMLPRLSDTASRPDSSPPASASGSATPLRWSTGSLKTKDIAGAEVKKPRARASPRNPLEHSDIPGTEARSHYPPTPPKTARPDVDNRKLGRFCFGDSGLFTKTERQSIVDPLAPHYRYDPRGAAWRASLADYAQQVKAVPRTWNSELSRQPGELLGRMEVLQAANLDKARRPYCGRQSACLAMYTRKAERAFEGSQTGKMTLAAWG